jgi:hypothetical protein
VLDRSATIDALYDLLDELRQHVGGFRFLSSSDGSNQWPTRGLYFFFEPGELRGNGDPRIVRVGTHALTSASRTTLWNRLHQHRGGNGGAYAGGGNHRGSIFRLHVGRAMLARDQSWPDSLRETWGRGASASPDIRRAEHSLELAVSRYIRAMPFLWLGVPDPPGPSSERATLETGIIALLSNLDRPVIDPPSNDWLGLWSDRPAIRGSGLWNVNHVADGGDMRILATLRRHVEAS